MIINVGNWHSGIRNAVVQFFKEYNGEEIKFEEEWYTGQLDKGTALSQIVDSAICRTVCQPSESNAVNVNNVFFIILSLY